MFIRSIRQTRKLCCRCCRRCLPRNPARGSQTDPQTGNLVALATPRNHATIEATLSQMQEDSRIIQVIPLVNVDPQIAVLQITRLFGIGSGTDEEVDPRLPVIDADLSSRSLLVRGSQAQIDQIRGLLEQMGETEEALYSANEDGNVRFLPLTASESRAAIEQLREVWPMVRQNQVRVVAPATAIRSFRPSEDAEAEEQMDMFNWQQLLDMPPADTAPPVDRGAGRPATKTPARLIAFQPNDSAEASVAPVDAQAEEAEPPAEVEPKSTPGAPILVAPGPNGLVDCFGRLGRIKRLPAVARVGGYSIAVR